MNRATDIVIVGAGGFLGHRLCAVAHGARIAGLCRSNPSRSLSGADLVTGDRRDPATVAALLGLRPAAWIDTGVGGPDDIASIIEGAGIAAAQGIPLPRFVITSTFGEYSPGLRKGLPISEDSETGADDPHSEGKLQAFASLASNPGPLNVTWAILPMMWGPGDHDGTGPGGRTRLLMREILEKGQIGFEGTCDNPVPDGFVDTIAAALLHVAATDRHEGVVRMIFAGPENLTPRGFVIEAAAEMDAPVQIVVTSPGPTRPRTVFPGSRVLLDCSRLKATGFIAACDWRAGVRKTARAFLAEQRTEP